MSDYILTLDQSSGRVHKRHQTAHGYQGLEGCNLDAAGGYQETTQDELDAMPLDVRCGNCLPEDDGSTQPEMEP